MERVILKSRDVRHEESSCGRRARATQESGRAEVRAISEDGVVRAIEVVCACGDRMTIQLDVAPEEGASPR